MKTITKKQWIILGCSLLVLIGAISGYFVLSKKDDAYHLNISDGNNTLVSGDITITKQKYFDYLLKTNGANTVLSDALDFIAKKEVKNDDKLKALVKSEKEKYASYVPEGLDAYAKTLNYKDEKDFVENFITPKCRLDLLTQKDIKNHLNNYIKEYQVNTLKMITFDKESKAISVKKTIKTKDDFDKALKENKGQDLGVVTKNSSTIDSNLKKKLSSMQKAEKEGMYDQIIKLSTDQYALVYISDIEHKDEKIITTLSTNSDVQLEVERKYLNQYHLTTTSKKLLNEINKINKGTIK